MQYCTRRRPLPPDPKKRTTTWSSVHSVVGRLAIALGGISVVAVVAPAAPPENVRLERFEFTRVEMAMPVRIVVYSDQKEAASSAAVAAFDRFRELNGILSDYDPESELNRLCRTAGTGTCVPVSDDLWRVLHRAQQVSEASEGAFDVTIGPLSRLWRRARRRRTFPCPERIQDALQRVDYRLMELDPCRRCVSLTRGEMQLDLGAIGKGYAVDQALLVLQQKGIDRALVDASGDIGVSGPPPDQPGWRIAVASLDPEAPPELYLWLTHRVLAHSGDAWQYLEIDGKRYSHIIDPRTGMGLTERSMVTVVGPDAMTADALASAASVLGPDRGLALIERYPGVAARIVQVTDGRTKRYVSSAWEDLDFAPPGRPAR